MKRTPFLFSAGTAMAARCNDLPWAATPLGEPHTWDSALKTLVPIVLASNQPMFVTWGPDRTLIYNDGYAEILGDKHPDALGRDFLDVWREIRDDLLPIVERAYAGSPVQMDDIELWMERRGFREETHFSFFYSPVRDELGEIGGFFCACNEITAQIRAERLLARSEAHHRGVLENIDEGFSLFDRDFTILEVNPAASRLVGLTREQMIGQNHWALFPGTFDGAVGALYREVLASQRPRAMEHHYSFPDGRDVWFEIRAFPVGDGLASLFRDVTDARRLKQEADASHERVQLALEAGAILGTWVWDIKKDLVVGDEQFALSFGLDATTLRNGAPLDYAFGAIHPDDRERVAREVEDAVARRGRYRCQYRVFRRGEYRWVEANGRVEADEDNAPDRFPGVLLDIEDRRRVEAERDTATSLLRTFIEAVPGAVFAKNLEGRYLIANRGTAEVLGVPLDQLIGRADHELLANPDEASAVMQRDRAIMLSGESSQAEEAVQWADGTPAIWWATKAPLRNAEGDVIGLVGTSVDITARKAAEDALRLSEQRSALAIEVAQLGTWRWDVVSDLVTADERFREMCGLDARRPSFALADLQGRVHPDDWPQVDQGLSVALDPNGTGQFSEEFRWVHDDGRVVWTNSRGSTIFEGGGENRHATAVIGSVTDVTERRHMIDALRQSDRRKDEFLAMLAHELRNPLAPIKTASHILKLAGSDAARVNDLGDIITRQVGHLTRLVDDLLDVSRVTRGLVQLDRRPVDLRDVVATAVEQAQPLVHARGHTLQLETGGEALAMRGDFHRLVQVVSNLLNNAAKYTPQGGLITIRLASGDGKASLVVSDNGVGIAPDMLGHVFELFTQAERTPGRSEGGLGIGLALVRSLVRLHGGDVHADSAGLHQGASFHVELPLERLHPTEVREPEAAVEPRHGRVLLVDDNADAVTTLALALELGGYSVTTATTAAEAIERVAREVRWDAFVLDIGLPDMSGYELATRLRASATTRDAVFVALTGYGQEHDRVISRTSGFDHHMVKPADIPQLMTILSTALGELQSPSGSRLGLGRA